MSRPVSSLILAAALVAAVASSAFAGSGDRGLAFQAEGLRAATERGAGPVIARTGNLTYRPDGMPAPSAAAARKLKSVRVKQNLLSDRLVATVELRAAPTMATVADLHVLFGSLDGNNCQGEVDESSPTAGGLAQGFTRSGATIKLNKEVSQAGYADWDCAFVAVTQAGQPPSQATTYDILIGPLRDVYGKPKLRITKLQLLRSNVKKLKLVPRVWTKVDVTVKNVGTADAPGVKVGGGGKGLKVRKARLGKIDRGATRSGEIKVKLAGKRRRSLKLVARSGGKGTRKVAVVPKRPPRRPVSGKYRSEDGRVTFLISSGRIVGWRGYMQTRCGGYPDLPTYTWNTYDFPRKKIGRDGIVNARDRGDLYTAGLQLRAAGSKVSKGHFYYSGPARCFASTTFTAKRR